MNVLVELEVPKSCEECPFAYMTEGVSHHYCQYVGYESDIKAGLELQNALDAFTVD